MSKMWGIETMINITQKEVDKEQKEVEKYLRELEKKK